MCGLCGVMTGGHFLTHREIQLFEQLMVVNILRGEYGAGMVMVPSSNKRSIKTARTVTDPMDYEFQLDIRRACKSKPMVLMGHTRSPTSGGFGIEHVHPVTKGKIIGMHNGTMEHIKGRKPDQKPKNKDDFIPTDSEMLFEAINEKGPDEAISQSRGAYALTWVNTAIQTLNFLRNNERPLSFATHENHPGTMFWSSEAGALEFILHRNMAKGPIIYRCPTDKLITFKLRNGTILPTWQGSLKSIPPDEKKDENNKVLLLPTPTLTPGAPPVLPAGANCTAVTDEFGKLVYFFRTYEDNAVEEGMLKMILATGCNFCNSSAVWTDYKDNKCHWVAREEFICHDCAQHNPTAKLLVETAAATKH